MDWPSIIKRLQDRGWTQAQIADQCGCKQPTISDLANDKTRSPSYMLGKELERLDSEGVEPPTKAEA